MGWRWWRCQGTVRGEHGPDDPPLFSAVQLDFKAIAATGSDMLRPDGDGAYVGLKSARDEDENDDRGGQLPHAMLTITKR